MKMNIYKKENICKQSDTEAIILVAVQRRGELVRKVEVAFTRKQTNIVSNYWLPDCKLLPTSAKALAAPIGGEIVEPIDIPAAGTGHRPTIVKIV